MNVDTQEKFHVYKFGKFERMLNEQQIQTLVDLATEKEMQTNTQNIGMLATLTVILFWVLCTMCTKLTHTVLTMSVCLYDSTRELMNGFG
jgi:hypothetical protein